MVWEIEPYVSVGPVKLGQSRNEIRQQLGPGYRSFTKDVGENETDAYDELGVHLYYDGTDRLEMLEAFEPAALTLNGVQLLGRDYAEVAVELAELGYKGNPTDVGHKYDDAGVALTLRESEIEGVAVFRKGYYES